MVPQIQPLTASNRVRAVSCEAVIRVVAVPGPEPVVTPAAVPVRAAGQLLEVQPGEALVVAPAAVARISNLRPMPVSQKREAGVSDQRARLDLQINLLAERELTRMLTLQDAIARHLGISDLDTSEIEELKEDVQPEALLQKLESTNEKSGIRQSKPDAR